MRSFFLAQIALAAGVVLAGCSANHHSIYRHQPLGSELPSATLVDAKQRAILTAMVPGVGPQGARDRFAVCAEPSPDVFTVLAQGASATGSFGQAADPKSIQAAASLAYSSAEQGSSIARTQTINMLREVMYRTCERYMNGAIGPLELPIQAVRDQRMMVATLAIEQLTAAAAPRVISIGASGSAAAGASSSDAVVKVAEAQAALQKADTAQKEKQSAYDKLEGASPACSAIKKKADAKETLSADETTKQAECVKAEGALATAKTERQGAAKNLELLESVAAQGGGGPASASTTLGTPTSDTAAVAQAAALEKVAQAVTDIVKANYDQDEVLLLCLKAFSDGTAVSEQFRSVCIELVKTRIQASVSKAIAEDEKAKAEAAEYRQQFSGEMSAILPLQVERFIDFWAKVADENGVDLDRARLAKVVDDYIAARPKGLGSRRRLDELKAQTTRSGVRSAFARLPPTYQSDLAK